MTQQAEDWVPVGSMLNDDVIAADVHTALAGAGIQSVAVGSLGLTVSVKASDAERARGVLRGLPDVTVVEDGDIVP